MNVITKLHLLHHRDIVNIDNRLFNNNNKFFLTVKPLNYVPPVLK